jgi:hypothetical protein
VSNALTNFDAQMSQVDILTRQNTLQGKSLAERQIFYHIAIAARVAAWDAYLNAVALEAIDRIGDPLNPEVIALRTLARRHSERLSAKFNTPNFDNGREFIINCTGYDPIASWSWPSGGLTWQGVQQRLNEILKIRHSFAHGFALPLYAWLPQRRGRPYLNKSVVVEVAKLIRHIAEQTDRGLDGYLRTTYAFLNPPRW